MATRGRMQELEQERGQSIDVIIAEELDRGGSLKAVAAALDVNKSTVTYWMKSAGVELRQVLVYSDTGYGLTDKAKTLISQQKAEAVNG